MGAIAVQQIERGQRLPLPEGAYFLHTTAEDEWLGLAAGGRAVFDPMAGEPQPGDVVAVWFQGPGPFLKRIALVPRKHNGKPVQTFDTPIRPGGAIYFDFWIRRVDKLVGSSSRRIR